LIIELSNYLDSVRSRLRLGRSAEQDVIGELETHIEDRFEELRQSGLSEEEAAQTCERLLGSARLIARQIYEAHSQGSWWQTLLASMPHILFALLFALNWWQSIFRLAVMVALILSFAIYGWWRGKPAWLFPWLGYSLLPVVGAGILLLYLPLGWSWVAILFYVPLVLWLIYSFTVQGIKRDWLYSSLMLLPVPVIIGWFMAVTFEGRFADFTLDRIQTFAPWIGLSFFISALSVGLFVRLRRRWLKITVLLVSGLFTLTLVAFYTGGRLGLLGFIVLISVMLGIFLTPALLERRLKHGGP
jgi:hypothetical protein